jgi:uncharacterized protein (DUF302 family)
MTTKSRINQAVRTVAEGARRAADTIKKEAKGAVRRRRIRRAVRQAGEAAAAAAGAAVAGVIVAEAVSTLRSARDAHKARGIGFEVMVHIGFEAAIERVTEALKREGFGVLTRIDAHETFQEKLNLTFRPYAILGACNPDLAFRALSARSEAGLLLPCTVTVEAVPTDGTLVRVADPIAMLRVGGMSRDPTLREIASDARERMVRVVQALSQG